jgi:tripartite-type tricarboxylate transporter receptor subunit TctC
MDRKSIAVVALVMLGAVTLPLSSARGQDVDFRGRNVTIYIGFGAGGSYDFFGRIAARHLGKHLKGNPTIVPQNMPGAGSFTAANFVFNAVARDGTALGLFTQNMALQEVLGAPGVKFKAVDFNWLGRITSTVEVHVTSRKLKTIADAREREFFFSGSGTGSPSETYPILMNALAGTKFKIISGYPGSTQGVLAIERGEVDGALSSWNSIKRSKPNELKSGDLNVFVQHALKRHHDLPQVPTIVETGMTERGREILEFYASAVEVGFALAAPPQVPPERVQALREGFNAMLKDPDFIAEFKKTSSDLEPDSGEAVAKVIAKMFTVPRDLVEETRTILKIK